MTQSTPVDLPKYLASIDPKVVPFTHYQVMADAIALCEQLVKKLEKMQYESSMFLMHENGGVTAGKCERLAAEAITAAKSHGFGEKP